MVSASVGTFGLAIKLVLPGSLSQLVACTPLWKRLRIWLSFNTIQSCAKLAIWCWTHFVRLISATKHGLVQLVWTKILSHNNTRNTSRLSSFQPSSCKTTRPLSTFCLNRLKSRSLSLFCWLTRHWSQMSLLNWKTPCNRVSNLSRQMLMWVSSLTERWHLSMNLDLLTAHDPTSSVGIRNFHRRKFKINLESILALILWRKETVQHRRDSWFHWVIVSSLSTQSWTICKLIHSQLKVVADHKDVSVLPWISQSAF